MSDFLTKIVNHIKSELSEAEKKMPLKDLAETVKPLVNARSFKSALSGRDSVNIIAEIKRASPSKGDICLDLDPEKTARDYEAGGAKCISVLTEKKFFKGGFDDFRAAKNASLLPVLRKDFIISPYQVYESALLGADCILLIAKILTKKEAKTLYDLATALNMDVLMEIHSEDELSHIDYCNAKLVGINNRNLNSFATDTKNAVTIVSKLGRDIIPVAASGIASKTDITKNLDAGINNFLIGESLVRSGDTVRFLQSLCKKE
jgi:indole-3-glycerol phosphate synthase